MCYTHDKDKCSCYSDYFNYIGTNSCDLIMENKHHIFNIHVYNLSCKKTEHQAIKYALYSSYSVRYT